MFRQEGGEFVDVQNLDKDSILEESTFVELFEESCSIERTRLRIKLTQKAKNLGVKTVFEELLKAYSQVAREMEREEKARGQLSTVENYTNFEGPHDNMYCGAWVAHEGGIFAMDTSRQDTLACYHPILPIERLKNLETGEEQIKLAYKRNSKWSEIIVPKTMITSANKIVALSGRGIAITSENAKLLVKYLADVENGNDDYINVQYSTSKLGWHGNEFIPYQSDIVFDGDNRFRQIFESVQEKGNRETWIEHMKELRATGRMESKFLLAASFSSVLVWLLGGLPFFVDLWGETEGGKTVSLMLAASVWANPDESQYIGDFKSTEVALEAKADMLNHLPMLLDDTSKTSSRIRDNFEGVVYDLCSGKGKSRSNKDLGINRENHWRNVMIVNGERPLSSYVSQGGAINRILEVECGERVYVDPQRTADIVKKNYGFAGKEFIEITQELGIKKIKQIQSEFAKQLFNDEKMQKQSISLSIVLTADRIATERIFKDDCYISMDDAKKVLIDRNELSDNERCYRYLQDKVAMNGQRFDADTRCEKWGVVENGYAAIYSAAFDQICKEGGFSKNSFLTWADKKCLIQTQNGKRTKVKKINGTSARCVFLKLNDDESEEGFIKLDDFQEKLPFS